MYWGRLQPKTWVNKNKKYINIKCKLPSILSSSNLQILSSVNKLTFVRLFDLCLFGFVGFLFLLVSGKGCGLWLWHSLDFSLTFFLHTTPVVFVPCGDPRKPPPPPPYIHLMVLLFQVPEFALYNHLLYSSSSWNFKIPWWFIKYWQYLLRPNGGPDIPYRTPIK